MKLTFFAACDEKYFQEHARAYVNSVRPTYNCIIRVVNPTNQSSWDSYDAKILESPRLLTSEDSSQENMRVFYSIERFIDLKDMINNIGENNGLLITDIDCYVNKTIDTSHFDGKSVGLFLRDPLPGTVGWEFYGTHVAAGVVFIRCDEVGLEFANRVNNKLFSMGPLRWFIDQVALYSVYCEMKEEKLLTDENFITLDNKFMDWEFKEDTFIWTGKGNRKHTNETYLNKKKEYDS